MMRIKRVFFGLTLILLGCQQSYQESREQRTQIASNSKDGDPIVIGIPWRSSNTDLFINGVKLAVKEVNAKGGVLSSPLQIIINDGESIYNDTSISVAKRQNAILDIANSFAANPNLIAVIGHSSSSISILASVVYENYGVLFLAPNATNARLTGHKFAYTFRGIPTNAVTGAKVAVYAIRQGYQNIAVLHGRGEYETELADSFVMSKNCNKDDPEDQKNKNCQAGKDKFDIALRRSFFTSEADVISLVSELKNLQKLDAVFIASNSQLAAKIYRQSRNVGIKAPFIGGETLDTKVFLDELEKWEGINGIKGIKKSAIPTLFDASANQNQQFIQNFKEEYGKDVNPDYLAASGYDMIKLFAHAVQLAQSRIPIEIAVTMRYMDACKGVAGGYIFKPNGDLKTKPLYFKHLENDHYIYERMHTSKLDETNVPICNDIDRDHDTIPNNADACPDSTPLEISKGVMLDGAKKGCPIDSDNDGVGDYKDKCPNNTAAEIAKGVDDTGCPIDTDKDGIPDYKDTDIDKDKVANDQDKCPKNTPEELSHGVNLTGKQMGCPVDSDADSVPDYRDACPKNTATEISQGVDAKGCPIDNDNDGVLDYQDQCPQTPANLVTNKEGCRVISTITLQESTAVFFTGKQFALSDTGKSYLDKLLTQMNVAWLKKIQITGYSTHTNKSIFESQLQSIVNYLLEKGIPVGKVEKSINHDVAVNKKEVVEFTFSQVESKTTSVEKKTDSTVTENKPETASTETQTEAAETATKSERVAPESQSESVTVTTPSQPVVSEKQVDAVAVENKPATTPAEKKTESAEATIKPEAATVGNKPQPAGIENNSKPPAADKKVEPAKTVMKPEAAASGNKPQPAGIENNSKPPAAEKKVEPAKPAMKLEAAAVGNKSQSMGMENNIKPPVVKKKVEPAGAGNKPQSPAFEKNFKPEPPPSLPNQPPR